MATSKQDHDKKDLIVIDFDQTIFYNPANNFSVAIPLDDILDAYSFFSEFMYQTGNLISKDTEFILISGRHCSQKEVIILMLEHKGFKIDHAYFNQMERTTAIDESSFLIKYWTAKVKLINQLRLSNEYKSIIVIDDDEIICAMLEKLSITVFQARISKDFISQPFSITFKPPQKRLMTDLQTILTPLQPQKEQTANIFLCRFGN